MGSFPITWAVGRQLCVRCYHLTSVVPGWNRGSHQRLPAVIAPDRAYARQLAESSDREQV